MTDALAPKRPTNTKAVIVASLLLWAMALPFLTSAQTPPELDLQLYVGLSIMGSVGTVYSVELLGGVRHGPRPERTPTLGAA